MNMDMGMGHDQSEGGMKMGHDQSGTKMNAGRGIANDWKARKHEKIMLRFLGAINQVLLFFNGLFMNCLCLYSLYSKSISAYFSEFSSTDI
nr:BPK_HP1_G0042920.mRNA.1.CDS.1 [Saccharomyces cerevisiae]